MHAGGAASTSWLLIAVGVSATVVVAIVLPTVAAIARAVAVSIAVLVSAAVLISVVAILTRLVEARAVGRRTV